MSVLKAVQSITLNAVSTNKHDDVYGKLALSNDLIAQHRPDMLQDILINPGCVLVEQPLQLKPLCLIIISHMMCKRGCGVICLCIDVFGCQNVMQGEFFCLLNTVLSQNICHTSSSIFIINYMSCQSSVTSDFLGKLLSVLSIIMRRWLILMFVKSVDYPQSAICKHGIFQN